MPKSREVAIDGFLLSGRHRSCCAFHCRVRCHHLSARKTAESDGLIVNSTGRLAYTVSPPLCFLFVGGVPGGEEGCYCSFFIRDPETRKKKLISPSLLPLLCVLLGESKGFLHFLLSPESGLDQGEGESVFEASEA